MSGYQDSNLGPPAPKAGALTGLRYTPNKLFYVFIAFAERNGGLAWFCKINSENVDAKVQLFSGIFKSGQLFLFQYPYHTRIMYICTTEIKP